MKNRDSLLRELGLEPEPGLAEILATALVEAAALGVHDPQRLMRAVLPSPCAIEAVREVQLTELLLLAACAEAQRAALETFDARYVRPTANRVSRQYSHVEPAELAQAIRERLLLGDGVKRLRSWRGRAPLNAWLRSVATRIALNSLPRAATLSLDEREWKDAVDQLISPANPEFALLEKGRQTELRAALREALRRLPRREKMVLRLHVFQSLSTEQLARMFNVNGATVRRWIQGARTIVLENVRSLLAHATQWSPSELDSALAGISKLDLGLSALGSSSGASSSGKTSDT